MKFFIKYKKEILIGLVLVFLYFSSRLVNLTALPIFTDEAIYLRWAQIAKNDANWRFISLTDGKQPLFVWLAMIVMKVISDPLIAGRVVSVISGIFGMLFSGLLAWELFKSKKVAFLSSVFYLIYPSSLFYDRMALMEGLLAVTTLITLYFSILLVKRQRLDIALLLGMAMGATMLVKTSGFFILYLAPLLILLFDFSGRDVKSRLAKFIGLLGISAVLSQVYYAVLRLSPLYHMIAEKDTTFVYPISEWIRHPLEFFVGNFRGMTDWLIHYLSWPLVLLVIFALFFSWKHFRGERIFLFLWFILPFTALALFGKVLYPRFILFMTMPLLVLAASSLLELGRIVKNVKWQLVLMELIIIPSLAFDQKIIFDITNAPLTQIDKGQYVNDWPAGWGVKESVEILQKEANKGKIAIFTDGTFGLMPYAIELYLVYDKNVVIKGLWPIDNKEFPKEIAASAKIKQTFFIANQKKDLPDSWSLQLMGKWQKGLNTESSLRLYKVGIPKT